MPLTALNTAPTRFGDIRLSSTTTFSVSAISVSLAVSSDTSFAFTGLSIGDVVILTPQAALAANVIATPAVVQNGYVTVRLSNTSTAVANQGAVVFTAARIRLQGVNNPSNSSAA